jgi:hypothetical protein
VVDVVRAVLQLSMGQDALRDGNEPVISQGTGTHTGNNGALVLSDSSKSWTLSSLTKGRSVGSSAVAYYIYNLTSGAYGIISSHTGNTVTASLSGGSRSTWNAGDRYKITGGYWSRDGIGRSTDAYLGNPNNWPPQSLDPAYFWGNRMNGQLMDVKVHNGTGFWCKRGQDYIVNAGPKPGYTPYAYPHPLRSGGGAGSGGQELAKPTPPRNVKVVLQ